MGNLLRATNLWGYNELVRELGGDPGILLERFHIPADISMREEAFLPYRSASLLLEASASELDCPDFGLRLSRWQGLAILGPIAVIARNSETVSGAFEAIGRYLHVHSPALRATLEQPSGLHCLRLRFEIVERGLPQQRQAYELSMANSMSILRLLGGQDAKPLMLFLPHERIAPKKAYSELFKCPVTFSQDWCGFHLPQELASRAIDHADPETKRLAITYLESRHAPGTETVSSQVADLIQRLLPTGQCRIETIAEQLGMHPRTLQRRLTEEGERYSVVLDRVRRELAIRFLCESGLHLSQIAGLLGYSEQSALCRSVRRWFGETPKGYRGRLRQRPKLQ